MSYGLSEDDAVIAGKPGRQGRAGEPPGDSTDWEIYSDSPGCTDN